MNGNNKLLFYATFVLIICNNVHRASSITTNLLLIKDIANELSEDLETIKNDELGIKYAQELYSTFKYTPIVIDANKTVHEIANKLEAKLNHIFMGLQLAKNAIQNMQIIDNTTKTRSSLVPCLETKNPDLSSKISKMCGEFIDMILYKTPKEQLRVDYVLQKLKSNMWTISSAIKQQYFLSSWDVKSHLYSPLIDCTERDQMLLWKNYIQRNKYTPKNILLLLDHGGSLSKYHLNIIKLFAKQLVATLDANDNLAIIAVATECTTPQSQNHCSKTKNLHLTSGQEDAKFLPANSSNKGLFNKFIDDLNKGAGATNHTLGFEKVLNLLEENTNTSSSIMVLYVSRGLLSSLTEISSILDLIAEKSNNITVPFTINTCAIIDESKPTIYETQFLQDIALQNFVKYNISNARILPKTGTMVIVNSSEAIGFAISHFYDAFNTDNIYDLDNRILLPLWDYKAHDTTISFSTGCFINNQFGLLGIDVYFYHFMEDITSFSNNQQKDNYIILIDLEGHVIMHPSISLVTSKKQQLFFEDILYFEKIDNQTRYDILNEQYGVRIVNQSDSNISNNIKYTWSRVGSWYIVCVVQNKFDFIAVRPYKINWPNTDDNNNIKLVYHQLEYSENSKLCRHHNQIATLDAGSLYLSNSCFQPLNISKIFDTNKPLMQHRIYNSTKILATSGLRNEIQDEIAAMAHILGNLRRQHMTSMKSKYIVRRYVSSYNGVLQMFPGSILGQDLEPTKRPWFLQAVKHQMKLVLTPPYLDEGGAGYIVTMSYDTGENVVVGIDVTYGYVYRLMLNRMPFCLLANITCFLMDDRGYLIYHPNLIGPNGHEPIEKQHIVHKESLVANDILHYKDFIEKLLCNSYESGTIQRYYKLNTSYSGVLGNLVHGVSYRIVAVPATNLFLGVVNATCCNIVATFCPCSMIDRLCLNCNRMEQKECECPCECPLDLSNRNNNCGKYNRNLSDNRLCNWYPEHVSLKSNFRDDNNNNALINNNIISTCFPARCSFETTYFNCLGITGCEWCKFDVDGTQLTNPFCASLTTCFSGVVGSLLPYKHYLNNNNIDGNNNFSNNSNNNNSFLFHIPFGLIIILIVAVVLIVSMFYFCYRSSNLSQSTQPAAERLYLSSTQDNQLRMSDLNLSDHFHDHVGNHRDKLLQDESKPIIINAISPYCVTTSGYHHRRRTTPTTADSDHGYSTMTQHDESEHLSVAPAETDSLEDDLTASEDTTSVYNNPAASHIVNNKLQQFTSLPVHHRNNCIVVPVTVHRNMETT